MTTRLRFALVAAVLASASAVRADTIQASSTTLLNGRQDYRDGNVQTAIPVLEMVDISATDIKTPYADNLEVALSTWGALDAASQLRFWQNGALSTDNRLSGDINVAYVRAEFLDKTVSLRLGRQMVADGVSRMIQIDGGELKLALPGGFGVQGYMGTPVMPRFEAYGGPYTVGNTEATFVSGGRVSWRSSLLEVGASAAVATDHGDPSRQDVGADFRLRAHEMLTFVGSGWWSVYEGRVGEASIAAVITPVRHVEATLDYRHVEPDLFLPRNSILSVFAVDNRNDVGGALHWGVLNNLALDADYHVLVEPAGTGHWARAKATAHPDDRNTTVGAEASYLTQPDNGYTLGRLFGSKTIAAWTGTLDLYGYFFKQAINGQDTTLQAAATVGYEIARGWRALVAGSVGSTAFLSRQFDVLAKLVYNETYVTREVR